MSSDWRRRVGGLAAGALGAFAAGVGAAPAAGEAGGRLFEAHCASCHALEAAAPAGAGPQLAALGGRALAGDPSFDYSPALRAARVRGERWDAAALDRFLADPEAAYPGTWMGANGLDEPAVRAAVVEFLLRVAR